MNAHKTLGYWVGFVLITLLLIGCSGKQENVTRKVGEPVSNGSNTITVTEVQRAPFNIPGFNNNDILSVTVVSETAPFNGETVQTSNANLTDSQGNTFDANGAGIDERDSTKAYFTFVIPQSSKGLEFHFLDYPAISMDDDSTATLARSGFLTYSEVLDTYPKGTELCKTEASLDGIGDGGNWLLKGNVEFKNSQMQVKCYGTKITVNVSVTIDGNAYPPGTLLTVDKDLNWIEVSSWK